MSRFDLFTWRDEAEAAADLQQAEEARALAARKARVAPHGEMQTRRQRLKEATHAQLAAELVLRRVQEGLK